MLLLCSHGEAKIAFLSAINVIGIKLVPRGPSIGVHNMFQRLIIVLNKQL